MLVITRKPGESVYIGDDIKISLQGIRGNQVRIGIDAPSDVRIYREEIYLQILEENQSAADVSSTPPSDLGDFAAAWKSSKKGKLQELAKVKDDTSDDEEDS